ncbi:MAG TPA: serine hydrolase domain-containing protein [Acidiferrobacterales bacterium]|nr:serine hydrolase domain-containing protein [Acidiferrobacterales bacterium]
MLNRILRRTRRFTARALAAVNLPHPPHRPETLTPADREYLKTHLRWYILRGMRKAGVPALSIALVDDQQLVWAEGFGYADRERRVLTTPETVYQIGSITKIVNALAVMQLVEQGRMDLDRPITDYLPEFSMHTRWPQAAPITPRALLCHHAGLPTYLLKGFFSGQSLTELLHELREEHLAFEPHTVFNYSNLGSNLLGLAVERLTGLPYAEAVQRQLLAPLGMHSTGVMPDGARLARGYVHDVPVNPTPVRDIPAGGLCSNILDLARLMRGVFADGTLDGQYVLDKNLLAATFEPQYPDRPLDFGQRFGLGWMLSGLPIEGGGQQAWHNGGTKAFVSQLALLPETKLGVVVLANADNAGDLVYEVAEEALRLALEIRRGVALPKKTLEPEVVLARDALVERVGDYSLMGSLARISLGKKRLKLHVLKHVLDLVPLTANRFRVEFNLLGLKSVPIPFPPVEFAQVGERKFALLRGRVVIPAEKIPPYSIPDTWRRCAGEYHIINPDAEYLVDLEHCRMLIENSKLLMDIRISGIENRHVKVVVVPVSDSEAYVFGLGRNVGDVARVLTDGERLRIRYSGYVFERE